MNCQYNLLLLFLCGFAALSVSTEECGKDLLVGTSCIIKRTSRNKEKPPEIKWVHDLNGNILRWKGGTVRGTYAGASMEEDGSLKMSKVSLKDTGKYKFYEFNADGAEIGTREVEIKVYEKAPKPTVSIRCTKDGNATLSCEIGNRKDLTVTWYKDKMIQNDKKTQVLLSFTQVQENKPYSCEAQNPVSKDKSESITVSCPGSGYGKLFGFDFWVMLGILAGGGALLLLLICVLIICACRSCRQRTKRQQDEEELRLEGLTPGQNGTSRSKQTARGQPAPPVPQEDSILCSPSPETPRSQTQPKAQIRARPPPPPQDEEDPPPLPQPRNKQHRNKRSQEPYRPME
ncbi:T-cell surface antigen CD2-like [Rhinichthys klamathensis goyatoka]|uniref:T-cell surface antigen CD2-like n=1 Tax=Rhinichthys klamathensis goyatoka TaxID=3034132 RepID=UPI0024B553F3|nr:T-cell surface antigen CD2-like [Rhinichthys klamathensis goyatoka]